MNAFEIIELILLHEGSIYTDDPADAGGPTRWGVTMPVLAQYRRVPVTSITARDIQTLTRKEAFEVYRFLFVKPFDLLPDSTLKVNAIDMGVNAGVATSVRLLQETVGARVDGLLGRETVGLTSQREWNPVFVGVRVAYYENLIQRRPVNIKWRNGWRNRALYFLNPSVLWSARPLTMPERSGQPRFGFTGKAYAA